LSVITSILEMVCVDGIPNKEFTGLFTKKIRKFYYNMFILYKLTLPSGVAFTVSPFSGCKCWWQVSSWIYRTFNLKNLKCPQNLFTFVMTTTKSSGVHDLCVDDQVYKIVFYHYYQGNGYFQLLLCIRYVYSTM